MSVAFVEVQLSVTDWPFSTVLGSAVRVQAGAAGGGGGGGGGGGATGFGWAPHPTIKTTIPRRPTRTAVLLFFRGIVFLLGGRRSSRFREKLACLKTPMEGTGRKD